MQEESIISENKASKRKQIILLTITVTVLMIISLIFLTSGRKNRTDDINKVVDDSKKIILSDPGKGIKAEDKWLFNADKKIEEFDEFKKSVEQDKITFTSKLDEVEKKTADIASNQEELLKAKDEEIKGLKSEMNDLRNKNFLPRDPVNVNNQSSVALNAQNPEIQFSKTIGSLDLNLEKTFGKKGWYNSDEYIPAGAYAAAKIISGVDASVGVAAQSNPRPILIRITGPAKSSIYEGDIQKADITGCLITGAASGDLSSEKVYVKLVKMTCGKGEKLVTEIPVKGYVAGQGKSGIRGNVVSREGDLLAKSFLAGLISGFGQGLSDKVAPPLAFSNGLTTQESMTTADVFRKGLGKGISNSSDKVGNYLMQRAEQYQPVISIPSDINVEVVFVEGFALDTKPETAVSKEDRIDDNKNTNSL